MHKTHYTLLFTLLSLLGIQLAQAQCPQITCPSNIVQNNTVGNCNAVVTYTTPVGINPCGGTTITTFNYTGAVQTYTVPVGVTSITVDAQGAQGGGTAGGLGGRAIATIPVTPGEVLDVYVGGRPTQEIGPGGFNGGGAIVIEPCGSGSTYSCPGGGASDVRRGSSLANRLIVGGGGGGQGWSTGLGGGGGGTTGVDGAASWIAGTHGKGGTQIAGGVGGFYSGNGQSSPSGTLGVGGNGSPLNTYCTGGAGGGGYYGGGGGYVSAGGGGSSFVAYPGNSATSTTASYRSGNGVITITSSGAGSATTTQPSGLASGATFPVGVTTNVFSVTDGLGNTTTCAFTVTVSDAEAPSLTCPANVTTTANTGSCSATVSFTAPTATDNCNVVTTVQTSGPVSGSAFPVGTTTVAFGATDAASNTSSCSFSVTVTDNEAPAITCPSNISMAATTGSCDAVVSYNTPAGTDNCTGVTTAQTAGLASGATFPIGVSTQVFATTDGAGNTATCAFTVTITDAENPAIVCPTSFTVPSSGPNCTAIVTYLAPVGTDNCPNASTVLSSGPVSGSIFPPGSSAITFTVTDASGNSSTCSFTVTVSGGVTFNQTLTICDGASVTVGTNIYTTAGIYTDTLLAVGGCDSVVTTLLTVNTVNTATSLVGTTLSASAVGAGYQWLDCDNGMAAISGATSQTFTPSQTGNYAVAITQGNCTDTSSCTAVTVVGVANGFGTAFTLSPNPGNGKVTVDFGKPYTSLELRVIDLSGKLLYNRKDVNGRSTTLDLRELPNGVYLIEVRSQEDRTVLRMVKQ